MPTLPTTDARRRAAQSRQGVVGDPTAGLVADTVSEVAGRAQKVVNQIQQQQDDLSYAQAKADMVVADMDARAGLADDMDHATLVDRYGKGMGEAQTKAVSQIRNSRDRKRFEVEMQLFRARGNEVVSKRARGLERDERRANIAASLEALRDGALVDTAAGSDTLAVQTARNQIDMAVTAGYYSAEEGQKAKEAWAESYAVAKVEMMPLVDQIIALQGEGTIADEIAPDVRNDMLNTAIKATDTEVTKQASQAAADEIYDLNLPLKDQLSQARDIADPDIRDMTVKRLKERHREDTVIAEEDRISNLEEVYGIIDTPGSTIDDIPSDTWAQLSAKDRHAVEKYVKPGKILTNYSVWGALNRMKQDDPQAFAKVDLVDYRSVIDTTDLQAFSDDQNKILDAGAEFDGYQFLTDKQAVDGVARQIGIDTKPSASKKNIEKMGKWNWRYDQEVNQFKRDNKGREPNSTERNTILDNMALQVVIDRDLFFDDKARTFEIEAEGVPSEYIDDLALYLTSKDVEVTAENLQNAYRAFVNGE